MKITLVGLGKMGSVLATRLLFANFDLTVFNRTHAKMQPLIEAGAKGADILKDSVNNSDVVITCLLDDEAVLESVAGENGFISAMKPNAIHLGTSTILPATSQKLTQLHKTHGSIYLAGNVLGVPKAAKDGQLTTIVAGDPDAIEQCKPIFSAYSAKMINVGTEAYQANVVKICMNYFLVTVIETLGELYTFGEKSGVDLDILQALFHSIFAHPAFQLYVDKIKSRNFDDVNFDLKGGFKDINLFQKAFADVHVVPDMANVIQAKFISALAYNMGQKDWSSFTEMTRLQANLSDD